MSTGSPGLDIICAAYNRAFSGDDGQVVLDDMTAFIKGLPLEMQGGGWQVIGHVLSRRSAKRRAQLRAPRKDTKRG